MDKNKDNIAVSALYTAGTWRWAGLPCAEFVTPANAAPIFWAVNAVMVLYRLINPQKFSLKHQLLHRHTAIDYVVARAGHTRIVEVAAGLSPRGSRTSANPLMHYTEVDLPDMAAFKRRQLAHSEQGAQVLARPNFVLRGGDVTTLDFAAEFAASTPVTVITEGLMMYFPRAVQLQIWQRIAALVQQSGGVYVFDYIPLPDEPSRSRLGGVLHTGRLLLMRALGRADDFAYDERSRSEVAADLTAAGFTEVSVISTGDIAHKWSLPQAQEPSRTLIYRCAMAATTEPPTEQGAAT